MKPGADTGSGAEHNDTGSGRMLGEDMGSGAEAAMDSSASHSYYCFHTNYFKNIIK